MKYADLLRLNDLLNTFFSEMKGEDDEHNYDEDRVIDTIALTELALLHHPERPEDTDSTWNELERLDDEDGDGEPVTRRYDATDEVCPTCIRDRQDCDCESTLTAPAKALMQPHERGSKVITMNADGRGWVW